MGQQNGRDAHVVVDDLGFGKADRGIHDLTEVAEAQLLALDLDFGARRHGSGISASPYMLPADSASGKSRLTRGQLSQHPPVARHQRWGERRRRGTSSEFLCCAAVPGGAGGTVPRGASAAE